MKTNRLFKLYTHYRRILSVSSFLLLLIACDPSDFKMPSWQPDFILPLIDAQLNIEDLILTTEGVNRDDDGLISIVYTQSEDFGTLEDLLPIEDEKIKFDIPGIPGDFPDFDLNGSLQLSDLNLSSGVNIDIEPFTFNRTVDIDASDIFKEAAFESGIIEVAIENSFPFTLQSGLTLSLKNTGASNNFYTYVINQDILPNTSVVLDDMILAEKVLDGNFTIELLNLSSPGANSVTLNESNKLQIGLSFKDVVFDNAIIKLSEFTYESSEIELPLSVAYGALLTEASIDKGILELTLEDNVQNGLYVNLELPNANATGEPLIIPLEESAIDIDNFVMDLSANNTSHNTILLSLNISGGEDGYVALYFNKGYEAHIKLKDIDYGYLKGYLGKMNTIIEDNIKLDFHSRVQSGQLVFNNPKINLNIKNSQGVNGQFYNDGNGLYLEGKNDLLYPNQSIKIGSSLLDGSIIGAPSIGTSSDVNFIINKDTEPNFGEFLALIPNEINYRLPVLIGTDEVLFNQFIYDKGALKYDLSVELPLELAAKNLVLTDTLPCNVITDYNDLEVLSATLETTLENYFPLSIIVQNYFLDENYNVIDSLFSYNHEASSAKLDELGNVTAPGESVVSVEVSGNKLRNISSAKYYKPVILMRTTGEDNVKLLSSHSVNIKTIGSLELNVNLNK